MKNNPLTMPMKKHNIRNSKGSYTRDSFVSIKIRILVLKMSWTSNNRNLLQIKNLSGINIRHHRSLSEMKEKVDPISSRENPIMLRYRRKLRFMISERKNQNKCRLNLNKIIRYLHYNQHLNNKIINPVNLFLFKVKVIVWVEFIIQNSLCGIN
jgi:hypothetical protein